MAESQNEASIVLAAYCPTFVSRTSLLSQLLCHLRQQRAFSIVGFVALSDHHHAGQVQRLNKGAMFRHACIFCNAVDNVFSLMKVTVFYQHEMPVSGL